MPTFDPNPFSPDVPDLIREQNPILYRWLVDQAETLRQYYADKEARDEERLSRLEQLAASINGLADDQVSALKKLLDLDQRLINFADFEGELTSYGYKLDRVINGNELSLKYISSRLTRLTDDDVYLRQTETLQVMANWLAEGQVSAGNADSAARRAFVLAKATNEFSRSARVYRDETGAYAESVTELRNESLIQTAESTAQASLALTYSTSASDSAASAQASAELAATYAGGAGEEFVELEARVTTAEQAIVDESGARATQTTELFAQLNGTNTSGLKTDYVARFVSTNQAIVDENAARTTSETSYNAKFAGTASSGLKTSITAVASDLSTQAGYVTTLQSQYGTLSASVTTQAGTIADHTGKLGAYWTVTAVAGGRAQLSIYADANTGGGVDITGNVRIYGNLLVYGTVTSDELALNSATRTLAAKNTVQYNIAGDNPNPVYGQEINFTNTLGGLIRIDFRYSSNPLGDNPPPLGLRIERVIGGTVITVSDGGGFSDIILDSPPASALVTYRFCWQNTYTVADGVNNYSVVLYELLIGAEFKR